MKLSVIVLTYNLEKYIGKCLDSVVQQKVNFDYEIVICDDGSSDQTVDILREYAKHYTNIKLFVNTINLGFSGNFCKSVSLCSGDYIAYFDGDDIMLPNKLQKQVDFLDSNPRCSIVAHAHLEFYPALGVLKKPEFNYSRSVATASDLAMNGFIFTHSSKMFRSSSIPSGGFSQEVINAPDLMWHLQSCTFGEIGYINEVLSYWTKHVNSMSSSNSQNIDKIFQSNSDLIFSLDFALNNCLITVEEHVYGCARINYSTAITLLKVKQYNYFKLFMSKSKFFIEEKPFYKRVMLKLWRVPKVFSLIYFIFIAK